MTVAIDTLAADHRWLPHRIDAALSQIEFVRLDRDDHRAMTFLEDKYLPEGVPRAAASMAAIAAASKGVPRPRIDFLFHSTFCLSTLAARSFDQPGVAMALKEPLALSYLASYRRRGIDVRAALDVVLTLLARPFAPGERVVAKPSNVANTIMADILALRPDARAVLLYSPLADFLLSVAKKGMWGRIEARRLFALLEGAGLADFGFGKAETFLHTDMQIAAEAWLGHHREFADLLVGGASGRLRTLDSARFAGRKADAVAAIAAHFGLALDVSALAASGVFEQHSKELGRAYDSTRRAEEAAGVAAIHGDEIAMVTQWAGKLAEHVAVPLALPRPLLD